MEIENLCKKYITHCIYIPMTTNTHPLPNKICSQKEVILQVDNYI